MICGADIITQPGSGEYRERIYDIENRWNSQEWTWVRFEEESEIWCGEFRGAPKGVALSKKYNRVLILTADYLYVLNCANGEIVEYESQPQYNELTVTPNGDFLVADYYDVEVIGATLKEKTIIDASLKMDMIKFHEWDDNKLKVSCYEFFNWEKRLEMFFDGDRLEWC